MIDQFKPYLANFLTNIHRASPSEPIPRDLIIYYIGSKRSEIYNPVISALVYDLKIIEVTEDGMYIFKNEN